MDDAVTALPVARSTSDGNAHAEPFHARNAHTDVPTARSGKKPTDADSKRVTLRMVPPSGATLALPVGTSGPHRRSLANARVVPPCGIRTKRLFGGVPRGGRVYSLCTLCSL